MIEAAWSILCESAVFILLGFLIAGLLEVWLPGDRVQRLLRGRRPRSVILAALLGVPLPLCSCSVLPSAVMLRKKGAGKGATLSFLISTPETSVTSILLTYALLGPLIMVFRVVAACACAIAAGLVENRLERWFPEQAAADADPPDLPTPDGEPPSAPAPRRLAAALRFAFGDLFGRLFVWILVGILAAAAIQVWLPPQALLDLLGGPLQSMLLLIAIGVPLYVCAEASTPIAAALIAQGVHPGAALAFLLVGPATNLGSLGILHGQLGRRTVLTYLGTLVVVALAMGALLGVLVADGGPALQERALVEPLMPTWIESLGAVAFLVLGMVTLPRARHAARLAEWSRRRLGVPASARGVKVAGGLLLVLGYAGSGFFTVAPGELGVVQRFGAIVDSGLPPGLHYALPYPVEEAVSVPVRAVRRTPLGFREGEAQDAAEAWDVESLHLIGDENIADLEIVVHWGGRAGELVAFQFGIEDREALVRSVVLGAVREAVAGASINTAFTTRRCDLEQRIETIARDRLRTCRSGIHLHSVHLVDAHAPAEVHAAFRDVAGALEDRSTFIHRAREEEARLVPQARGEAATNLATARGTAARVVSRARGEATRFLDLLRVERDACEVTRQRLRFEMLEKVLPRLRKYLEPPDEDSGELEIWLVAPEAAAEVLPSVPGG